MKKIYTVLSILLTGVQISNAQLTLTKANNEPAVGDVYMAINYDSTTVIPKSTGAGMSWNFTSLNAQTFTETTTYTTVASTPSASSFPNATIAALKGSSNWEFWRASAGMLEYDGSVDQSSGESTIFSNRAMWILWPTSFGTNSADILMANQTVGTNTATWNGNISYTATGSGTVTLPNGNVHTNCLQLKRNISLSVVSGTNTTQVNIINYEYYSSSAKFPILTIDYETVTTGTVVNRDYSIYVNQAALTVGMKETELTNNFVVFPNPAESIVKVNLPGNEIAESLAIYDLGGREVAAVYNTNFIDVASLANAVYMIRVKGKEGIFQKKLVISK